MHDGCAASTSTDSFSSADELSIFRKGDFLQNPYPSPQRSCEETLHLGNRYQIVFLVPSIDGIEEHIQFAATNNLQVATLSSNHEIRRFRIMNCSSSRQQTSPDLQMMAFHIRNPTGFSFLAEGVQIIHDVIAVTICLPKPRVHLCSLSIDISHELNLPALFVVISLVDAEEVDPYDQILGKRPERHHGIV